jgi:1-acyl-sn-glycerol-3-phosphate acyltransferase
MIRRAILDPIRTVALVAVGVLDTWVCATIVTLIALRNPRSPWIDKVARVWSKVILAMAGVELDVYGSHHVDPNRSYVVVSNHLSNFDIPAHFVALPVPIRFLAKKELYKIPVFGTALRAIGIIEVDRQAGARAHEQINEQAAAAVERGHSLLVYAEGTRSRSGELRPFKGGAFAIAVGSTLPILPVTVHGGHEAWPPGTKIVRGGRMTVVISEPIETAGLTNRDLRALRDRTRVEIASQLDRLSGP